MKKQISPKIVSFTQLNFLKKYLTGLIFAILVICFAIAFYAFSWTGPGNAPPICPSGEPGCDAPINIGGTFQYKSGALGIGGVFRAYSNAIIDGDVGIGTTSPNATLEVKGTMKVFGAWSSPIIKTGTAAQTDVPVTQATTDGFFIGLAYLTSGNGDWGAHITGYSDSNPDPGTIRGYASVSRSRDNLNARSRANSFTTPVKKDEYYKATYTRDYNTPSVTRTYYRIPLGD